MAANSKIEWTDATWNPITGCALVSEGCRHCYAAELAVTRLQHHPSRAGLARRNAAGEAKFTGEVRFNEQWLDQPLRWRKGKKIFVCAHGDLFAENVPDEWIDHVFAVMALAPQHTFQVLTKRPERARAYLRPEAAFARVEDLAIERAINEPLGRILIAPNSDTRFAPKGVQIKLGQWPLPNVWLGTSVEDQATADERIPHLLATPAAVRFVSAEPLLGPVDFGVPYAGARVSALAGARPAVPPLDWVIVGGESGPHARDMNPDWARSIRDQCVMADVAFFFKQMARKVEIPADLMVRQFPKRVR